ncbi:glucokinase [soil metagenome]
MILAGDIGGTNTRLALFEKIGQGFQSVAEKKFSSSAHQNLAEIIQLFLGENAHPVDRACFGVPGAVRGTIAELPNLPWSVNTDDLAHLLKHNRIGLINDLEANAYGLRELDENEFAVLNQGEPNPLGNCAVISAGTGLGQAGIHNDNGNLRPFAAEGGHADFAPRSELEIELLRYLLTKFKRVSVERVVSGRGLQNIYEFLRDTKRAEEPDWLAEEIKESGDVGAVVSKHGLDGKSAICEQTLDIFVSLYGAAAGNLALQILATGGIYLGGGIAPKILPKLKEEVFLESFTAKGRMRELLEKIPVRVILNDKAALIGAAHFAFYEISET